MDPVIDKEIQNLIDNNVGNIPRLEFIRQSLQEDEKIYNSNQKYLMELLHEHSKNENILERLDYMNPKLIKKIIESSTSNNRKLHFKEKWCIHCQIGVFLQKTKDVIRKYFVIQ